MKASRIASSMSFIDDDLILATEETQKKPEKLWLKWCSVAASFLLVAALSVTMLPHLLTWGETSPNESEQSDNGIYWVDNRQRNDMGIVVTEKARVWPWECLENHERFLEIEYNGKMYSTRVSFTGDDVSKELVGEKLAEATAKGYDIYEDKSHAVSCTIYEIKNVDSERLVAVRYAEEKEYYVFANKSKTNAKTLGEFISSINLSEYCELNTGYFNLNGEKTQRFSLSADESAAVWQIILKHADAALVTEFSNPWANKTISFSVTADALGANNLSLSFDTEGYLKTNAEGYGYEFFVGKDAVNEISEYVAEHKSDLPQEPSPQRLTGIITEIGDDYIMIDDSIMMKDPDDGIVFKVYANNSNITKYLSAGFLSVGQSVTVEHGGIYKEEPTVIKTATVLYEVYVSSNGNVYIPE